VYDSATKTEAINIVHRFQERATREWRKFNKLRADDGWYPCRALHPEGRVKAGEASYIWFEVKEELKAVSLAIGEELEPCESRTKIEGLASDMIKLEAALKKRFPDLYDGQKVAPNPGELAIMIIDQFTSKKDKK
jgi:hypothetical protein